MILRLTGYGHDVRPPELASFLPQPRTPNLGVRALEERYEAIDGGSKFLFARGLCSGVLGLKVAVEGRDEDAVDVVGLKCDEGACVCRGGDQMEGKAGQGWERWRSRAYEHGSDEGGRRVRLVDVDARLCDRR